MSPRLLVLVAITAAFGGLSVVALAEVGYIGIFEESLEGWATTQVLFDLVIVALLGVVWMLGDARERGINPWPFVAITLLAGSFGLLFYLIARELRAPVNKPVLA